MSPEQLQGNAADSRSDLFSFGCVLYELISGKRAFEGQSAASVIAAILEREPEPLKQTPLERVVKRCLAKDPDQRFQTARDLTAALVWSLEEPAAPKRHGHGGSIGAAATPPGLAARCAVSQATARVERGLRGAREGTCEPGGSYRLAPAQTETVRALIATDHRFADTSVWVTTSRHWVTLQGCVPSW